jgi:DNA invertase Pin-like site-specific DNA recombinase
VDAATESATRQYALRQNAIALGWPAEAIVTIDTDQGQSGASDADREGFQRPVAEVSMGRAGIVQGLEVSRLARNNADWHRPLQICAMSATLICDEDGLYDPTDFNDRLLLGLQGTMSEAELHFIRARLIGGQQSKARRGELMHGPGSGWPTTQPATWCSTRIPVCNKPSGTYAPCSPAPARPAR